MLWTVKDVAAALKVGTRTVWQWSQDGILPAPIKLGRLRRWRPEDIQAWLAERAQAAGEAQSGPAEGVAHER